MRLEVAVIGTGISGLSAAWLLSRRHGVRVFEKEARPGGHAHTQDAPASEGGSVAVDTGFLVFNRETYPNLCRLFETLGTLHHESDMSFSVRCEACALEWCGSGISGVFAQPSNLASSSFLGMLKDISRFNREAPRLLDRADADRVTLGAFLREGGYGDEMKRHYLAPMAAAVWSSGTLGIEDFPASLLVRFFRNHGFLGITTQYRWRTVTGGSRRYVEALTASFRDKIHLAMPVRSLSRDGSGVTLRFADGGTQRFDAVVVATHADEALAVLADPSAEEARLLGAWTYSANDTFLHGDESFLPSRRRARASWNYHLADCRAPAGRVTVTYDLNRLQGVPGPDRYLLTLNPERPLSPGARVQKMVYTHPVYTTQSLATQAQLPNLNGPRRTYFAGAYFGNGFHEDGLNSGIAVAGSFGVGFP
ncbi:MAG: FAD-dependent oxidoreductase [Acidobacteriota bacterium]